MSDNNLVRSFVAVLYHVGEEVAPSRLSPGMIIGCRDIMADW